MPLEIVAEPVKMALRDWNRRCELSADRAGAVAVGSSKPIVSTMIRLAGGPRSVLIENEGNCLIVVAISTK